MHRNPLHSTTYLVRRFSCHISLEYTGNEGVLGRFQIQAETLPRSSLCLDKSPSYSKGGVADSGNFQENCLPTVIFSVAITLKSSNFPTTFLAFSNHWDPHRIINFHTHFYTRVIVRLHAFKGLWDPIQQKGPSRLITKVTYFSLSPTLKRSVCYLL